MLFEDFKELKELYSRKFSNGYWDLIENNQDKPWNWWYLSLNSNITWEIISNNLDKSWNWGSISYNKMDKGKDKWIKEHIKKDILRKISYRLLCQINDDKDINEMICIML